MRALNKLDGTSRNVWVDDLVEAALDAFEEFPGMYGPTI